ncbi:MAG: DUF4422 domain-containing protein [Phoenicibacter congonensis]|uniref:DUF4422 domain-containing protein n=1 Tax=Phoenicibacter congonensis TaxID=1944646 RepID=A0AA43UB88_9ACTN|nr:DUF4422 domain-containing protein [Phoenicibacter congonensis]
MPQFSRAESGVEKSFEDMKSEYEKQDVKIFVTTHKDVDVFDSAVLQPVQVSAEPNRERLSWAFQDDSGENIADKNEQFCELTTQFWAWKNVEAEYYGFCHYRRYFDFSDAEHKENDWGEVVGSRINCASQKRFKLDDASIKNVIKDCDIVTTRIHDISKFPDRNASVYEQFANAPYLRSEDLDRMIEILLAEHPDYADDAEAYLLGSKTCFCNMFIMRKELFSRYCEWLFPMLFKFSDEWDTKYLSQDTLRTPGHLAERLFNIWLIHEKRVNPELKHKQLKCVHFEHPERYLTPCLAPLQADGKPVVPVVFASDDAYVPMVTTTIYSMLKNASSESFFDIVILESDITSENKEIMLDFFSQFKNASIRFADVSGMIDQYDLKTSNGLISVETYYRFLIQNVLPEHKKVLYLDSDLIIKGDVAELFATELGSNLLGAAHDTDFLGSLNIPQKKKMEYAKSVLGMKNPYNYFQAGVLVMNLAEIRKLCTSEEWLEIAANPEVTYTYDDQDILNSKCEGRVTFIDNAWNVMNDCNQRISKIFSFAPSKIYRAFLKAYENPKIVHYAGFEKPWFPGGCDKASLYWSYARQTPFYEQLISIYIEEAMSRNKKACDALEEHLEGEVRNFREFTVQRRLGHVLPEGTRRREAVRTVIHLFDKKDEEEEEE